ESGMQGVYGAGTADKFLSGFTGDATAMDKELQDSAIKVIQDGKLKAETIASDADIAEYISTVAAQGKATGTLTRAHLDAVNAAARAVDTTPQLAQRVTGNMRPHVDTLKTV
ncbi:MAG: hypothetical protein KDA17_04175, partial [Candidatus Saccharibacteria bacterium]|nr:hypothetical protein [Candidatus Saccharibacteria bacterium]